MRCLFILSFLLITPAVPSFAVADAPLRVQDLSVSNGTISTGNPSTLTYPWGPNDFTTALLRQGRVPFAQKACFVNAVQMLAGQAAEDFYGRMRSPRMTFTSHEHPELAIIVMGVTPTDRIRRRYAFWGVARMMNHLVWHNDFRNSTFQLNYRDRPVGQIYIGPVPTSLPETAAKTAFVEPPSIKQLVPTAISNETEMLSWQYEYFGHSLAMNEVLMGTVGALVVAARPAPDNKVSYFVAGFSPYRAVHHWASSPGRPPPFTYSMLIKSIQATAMHALDQMDFHELGVRVTNGVQEVGWGGYVRDPALNTANYLLPLSSFRF
ncbi:MAG: hypothetical protein HETSPECPRED_010333 [Heterodermia speciosa]|uniref:Uncharacterized protein n=1 Tax=Heterodermia speciosa TaxID=116794 RepID=A0A8H3IX47_9LECA|nr:MAG: hypothetical protein HETSPECPRED_010333 [Heterodermia speciosa]